MAVTLEFFFFRCSKELGQWDLLMEFGKSKGHSNPFLVLESAWRVPDWQPMKEALAQVRMCWSWFLFSVSLRMGNYVNNIYCLKVA